MKVVQINIKPTIKLLKILIISVKKYKRSEEIIYIIGSILKRFQSTRNKTKYKSISENIILCSLTLNNSNRMVEESKSKNLNVNSKPVKYHVLT